jgi:hypothetical protein
MPSTVSRSASTAPLKPRSRNNRMSNSGLGMVSWRWTKP